MVIPISASMMVFDATITISESTTDTPMSESKNVLDAAANNSLRAKGGGIKAMTPIPWGIPRMAPAQTPSPTPHREQMRESIAE